MADGRVEKVLVAFLQNRQLAIPRLQVAGSICNSSPEVQRVEFLLIYAHGVITYPAIPAIELAESAAGTE